MGLWKHEVIGSFEGEDIVDSKSVKRIETSVGGW